MKLTIVAATGGVGRHLLTQALAAGHQVTAVVRDPGRLAADVPALAADLAAADPAELATAVAGADAVLSALGTRTRAETGVATTGTRTIVEAMQAAGVRRLVVISAAPVAAIAPPDGAARPGPGDGLVMRRVAGPLLRAAFRRQYADLVRMEDLVRHSRLDWTVCRPPYLTRQPLTGRYRTAYGRNVRGGWSVSRADLAHLMLLLLDRPESIGRTSASPGRSMVDSEIFERHRGRMFGIAYRMLGSVAEAEDVLQDAWLRWSERAGPVEQPGAYLARTVTNLALNRLASAAVQRERYVGPWLPEPLVDKPVPDVADEVDLAESVSLAMLVVLESLSPLERAVFVLREVFGYPVREVAQALGRGEAAVRQLAHRARAHVSDRRPRFPVTAAEQRRVTEQFLAACTGGDLGRLLELLAPDVVVHTDGGGKVYAARSPVRGAEMVAREAVAAFQRIPDIGVRPALVNGRPGAVVTSGGVVDSVLCLDVVGGRVVEIRVIRNPEKLRHVRGHPQSHAPGHTQGDTESGR